MKGRLAMAFGARGQGSRTGIAHYEPVHRVINITKMAGGGSLAHEWFHALDNMLGEAITGQPASAEDFLTEGAADDRLPPEVRGAVRDLVKAMMEGPHRQVETLAYTPAEARWAQSNATGGYGQAAAAIRKAGDMQNAVDMIETMHAAGGFGAVGQAKTKKRFQDWRKVALIYHAEKERQAAGTPEDAPRQARFFYGPGMSMLLMDAMNLDEGVSAKYWSSPKEMAARAFSAWTQDKLEAQERRNTYLVSLGDNEHYKALGPSPATARPSWIGSSGPSASPGRSSRSIATRAGKSTWDRHRSTRPATPSWWFCRSMSLAACLWPAPGSARRTKSRTLCSAPGRSRPVVPPF